MRTIEGISKFVDNCIRAFVKTLVAIMFLSVLAQVFFRYFLGNPLIWSEELARFCMIWITFFGAMAALQSNGLVSVDLLVEKLPSYSKKWIQIANYLIMLAICTLLFYLSAKAMFTPGVLLQKSSALRIPMQFVYFCLPVSYGLAILQLIVKLILIFRKDEVKT